MAQSNNDGAIVGHAVPGTAVTLVNPSTGFQRTVTTGSDGSYRFSYLPVGQYTLTAKNNGETVGQTRNVTVALGKATTVNIGATSLSAIEVVSSNVTPVVDVTSTVSAMNITAQELSRVPVERNVTAVALLAPGVVKGNSGIGGISFGGSSGAENSYYINGLNVTGFYSRMGFSEAPYAFYKQFQVKTGGYSVKYGRTTGGVVNAVVNTGDNTFHFGADMYMEPRSWASTTKDRFDSTGRRYITSSRDSHSLLNTDVWASGPIIKDKLFFFALYQPRSSKPRNTNGAGTVMTYNDSDTGFYGGTLNWNVTQSNTLELMFYSNKNETVGETYPYDFNTGVRSKSNNTVFSDTGGRNGNLTWTSYFTDNFSMKLMYGQMNRQTYNHSMRDDACGYVAVDNGVLAVDDPGVPIGCTTNSTVTQYYAKRKQYRADFLWTLGDHLITFGYDHENNTIDYSRHYAGPEQLYYTVSSAAPGATLENGATTPPGSFAYVRTRDYRVEGDFSTINSAIYVQDDWSVTPNFILSMGLRNDKFNNQAADGRSYIRMNKQIAPRLGFSWNVRGDGTLKIFGNAGRYFLPVATAVNVTQAGPLLDLRKWYAFNGWQIKSLDGSQYAVPVLGQQLGTFSDDQGDGKVGDLRSGVDRDMDPVYQDEFILGFQQMITDKWSWGVSATYRTLHGSIDDMHITATPQCGGSTGGVGWVMGNAGENMTVWGDTNCDGTADGWLNIDTSKEGWAMYDNQGNYLGQRGWKKPKRTYTGLTFTLHRAWDEKWFFDATYVLSWNRGNAEGPVNTDSDYDATNRTENWDTPYVNWLSGNLPNDRRNVLKLRGAYAFNSHWKVGGTFLASSGNPITAMGVGDPFDSYSYWSEFICVQNCTDPKSENWVYETSPGGRGGYGRTPFIFNLNLSLTYEYKFGQDKDFMAKLSVFNALNRQATTFVDQTAQNTISNSLEPTFLQPISFQPARYGALTFSFRY